LQPAFVLSQGFPVAPQQPLNNAWGAVPIGQAPIFAPEYWVQNRAVIYTQQWNFGIQKKLGSNLLEVGYMGTGGRHLPNRGYNPNQLLPSLMGPVNAQVLRPYPQFGSMSGFSDDDGTSNYNALLVSIRRHFSKGLNFQANYTYSNMMDDISYKRSDYNRKEDYGPSPLQLRHNFVGSWVYESPFGKGKSLLRSGPGAQILGGWLLGGFLPIQSGVPLNFSNSNNTCNCFTAGTQGVNVTGPVRHTSNFQVAATPWFTTSVFENPAPFTFGNGGPGLITAPGSFTININLTRRFILTERYSVEFRMDAFNLANRVNFSAPDTVFGTPGFGMITSSGPGRLLQYAAKFFF
jgi:hypothetical protein